METREEIFKRSFSDEFLQKVVDNMQSKRKPYNEIPKDFVDKMKNAIETSHYKYGWPSQTYPELAQAYKCAKERVELYMSTHNLEFLVDTVNFLMLEYMFPSLCPVDPQTASYKVLFEKYVIPQVIPDALIRYGSDGFKEYLIHSAAIAVWEYIDPQFKDAEYRPTSSSESPGLAGGISYKELMENKK